MPSGPGEKIPVTETVTAAGNTTLRTPAAGRSLRIHWVYAVNDPDEEASPLISITLGQKECYRAYAVSHTEVFSGRPNEALVVNLDEAGSVAVTVHLEEF